MRRILPAVLLIAAGSVFADENTGVTIAPSVGVQLYDNDRKLDNDAIWGLTGGYRFDNPWAIELGYIDGTPEPSNGSGKVDATQWRLDGLYHFGEDGDISPFLSFGVGQADFEYPSVDFDESTLNVGFGTKYFFSEHSALRADLKLFRGSDTGDMDVAFLLSLHTNFGASGAAPVAAPRDSDGDGVMDGSDRCPNTPAGASVDSRGCALDTDKDGVADYKDACPDTTRRGARIDDKGCYVVLKETVSVELNVEFDLDSAKTRPEHRSEVERVFKFMQEYPQTRVTVEGHTDSRGQADYNKDLSERRARAIADMLINDFGVSASRVSAVGYGEERPVASNETAEGQQKNRRVVGVIEATVERIEKR